MMPDVLSKLSMKTWLKLDVTQKCSLSSRHRLASIVVHFFVAGNSQSMMEFPARTDWQRVSLLISFGLILSEPLAACCHNRLWTTAWETYYEIVAWGKGGRAIDCKLSTNDESWILVRVIHDACYISAFVSDLFQHSGHPAFQKWMNKKIDIINHARLCI